MRAAPGMLTRAPIGLAGRAVVHILLALACIVLPAILLASVMKPYALDLPVRLVGTVARVLLILLTYGAYMRWIERRPAPELAWCGAPRQLLAGVAIGAALFALSMAILAGVGVYRISGYHHTAPVLAMIPLFVIGAVFEEVIFRAVIFRILEQVVGSWLSLLISALIFGLMHFGNPGAGWLGALVIAIEAGVMLGAAYMLTRQIWLCIAIHFGWNFTQGGIFSVAVSGTRQQGFFQSQLVGPDWLTGGAFGAELSVVAAIVCLLFGVAMLVGAARRGNLVRPCWRDMPARQRRVGSIRTGSDEQGSTAARRGA